MQATARPGNMTVDERFTGAVLKFLKAAGSGLDTYLLRLASFVSPAR